MARISIITDSDSSLPADLAASYNIVQVPITVQFGDETFETGIDINDAILFEKIDKLKKLPTTAAPSPAAFAREFKQAFAQGADSIICITVGSKISRTYDSAVEAVAEFPGKEITVIDSEYLSLGQGFMVLAAAEAVAAGATHAEAVAAAKELSGRMHLFGSLPTLKYLAMGGRVSTLTANMADWLEIRPVMTMQEGKLGLLEKVRTHKAAINRLVNLLVESVKGKHVVKAGIIHVNNLVDAADLETRLRERIILPHDLLVAEFTPGLSVHAGAGMVAAILITKE